MSPPPRPASVAKVDLYARPVRRLQPLGAGRFAPCPICRAPRARPRFAVEGVESPLVTCCECGLARFEPMLEPDEVRAFYPDEYYGEPGVKFQPLIERLVRLVGARHIGFLSRGLAPGARILDVGCGRGVILGPLADRGFRVHGVEVSAAAARGADPRAEIRIAPRLVDAGYPDGYFDEVVIWHVLEHLPDPRDTLEEAHRILKPSGRLIVAVPNLSSLQAHWSGAAWFHLDLPRHLYHFPLDALRRLLGETGFEVVNDHHFSLRQNPFGWIQSALNRLPWLPRNGLYTLLHRRAPGEGPAYSRGQRAAIWALSVPLVPLALLLTLIETFLRSGGTVHVVARRCLEVETSAPMHLGSTTPASSPA